MALQRVRRRIAAVGMVIALAASSVPFAAAQRGGNNYYDGMHQNVQRGNYDQRYNQGNQRYSHGNGGQYNDRGRRDDHKSGGIGPGYGALIGAGGGAALGALFGGGLEGTLIGGAAGAGLGALGGKLAQGNNNHRGYDRR